MSDIPVLLWILIVLLSGLMFLSLAVGTAGFLIWDLFKRIQQNEDNEDNRDNKDNKKGP